MGGDLCGHLGVRDADLAVAPVPVVVQVVREDYEEPRFCEVVVHCVQEGEGFVVQALPADRT